MVGPTAATHPAVEGSATATMPVTIMQAGKRKTPNFLSGFTRRATRCTSHFVTVTTPAKPNAEQIAMMRFGFVIDLSNCRKAAIGSPDNKAITNPATKSTSRVSKRFTSAQTVTNTTATAIQIVQLIVSPDNYCVLIDRSFP